MPISNNTDERVGVEVSGPTRSRTELGTAFTTGLGTGLAIAGLVLDGRVVTIVGVSIAVVSAVLFALIRSGYFFRHVLKPGEDLRELEDFDDLLVDFYQVDTSEVFGNRIASADFTGEPCRVTYFLPGLASTTEKVIPTSSADATHVRIIRPDPSRYRVEVSSASP